MDEKPKVQGHLLDSLSAAGKELAPVHFRVVSESAVAEAGVLRVVKSKHYRSHGYMVGSFHKPISKCLK